MAGLKTKTSLTFGFNLMKELFCLKQKDYLVLCILRFLFLFFANDSTAKDNNKFFVDYVDLKCYILVIQ